MGFAAFCRRGLQKGKIMNRMSFPGVVALALALVLCCVVAAPAADELLAGSFAADPVYRLDVQGFQIDARGSQPTAAVRRSFLQQPTTSALIPRLELLDNPLADLISPTTNRLSPQHATIDRRSEFAALIHPLGNSVQPFSPVFRTSADLNSARASVTSGAGTDYVVPTAATISALSFQGR